MTIDLTQMKFSRRDLLAKASAVGLGAAALTVFAGKPAEAAVATVADVLNFALNLEYLEAEFYTYATTGHGIAGVSTVYGTIETSGMGMSGATTGSGMALQMVDFPNAVAKTIAEQITIDEQAHVALLRDALGGLAIAKPAINLSALDSALAGASSYDRFLILSRSFEDTGVSAYSGGSTLLRSSVPALQYAAQILAVEAYHASNVRFQLAMMNVGAPKLDPIDVPPPPTGDFYFNVTDALAVTRSASQVLGIAYGLTSATSFAPAGKTSGGFFPNGANGTIHST